MYLKSIEVHGFKSFANKIVFDFHNGITGIVGPNGSGKSNVADAVRWVLGEQRVKQLRSSSMQDVIFSGTENRKPLGYAYVAITLDNSDHQLPIDYEEVTIARRVYRSGESEYLLNGTSCRLKDVNELFYDTGIGKEGYSIIGQGQIERILSGKPEERRELFDEAAGIVKYKRRKATAQKKLENERQNLVRVKDILSELEKQIGPLERQSEIAKIYLKKKEELKTYDVNMFLMEIERLKEQSLEISKKLTIVENDLEETNKDYENTKSEYEKIEVNISNTDEALKYSREELNNIIVLRGKLEGQINVLKEQINTAKMNDEHLKNRMESIQSSWEEKKKQQETLKSEREAFCIQLENEEKVQEEALLKLHEVQNKNADLNKKIESGKNEIIQLLNDKGSTKGKLQRYDTMLEQVNIRKAQLSQRLLKLKSDEAEQDILLAGYRKSLEEATSIIVELENRFEVVKKQIDDLKLQRETKSLELEQQNILYHSTKSKLDSLKNLTERYDGYGNSIRKVMENKDREPGLHGVVADIIKVEKEYEIAIETALGGSIQNIVTDNENTAKKMIEFLKKNKFGRATFLPLTSIGNRNSFQNEKALSENGVIGLAHTLIKVEKEYEELAKYLLGRTVVVDHIDHAIALAKKFQYSLRIVTLEGESLNAGGSMTGGAFKNSSNLLGRRREIEEIEESLEKIKKSTQKIQDEMVYIRNEYRVLSEESEDIKKEVQEQYIIQNTAQLNVSQAEAKREEAELGFDSLKIESAEIEKQILEITDSKELILLEMSMSDKREKEIEKDIEQFQSQLEEAIRLESERSQLLSKIQMEVSNLKQKEEFMKENEARIHEEMKKLADEKETLGVDANAAVEDVESKNVQINEIRQTIEKSNEEQANLETQIKDLEIEKEKWSSSYKGFFEKREDLAKRINQLDKEVFRLNSQKEKTEEQLESQTDYMWHEYELTYHAAAELRDETMDNLGQMKKVIGELKDEIRKLGDVNVNAIEDYKNLSERYEFLKTQHDDLVIAEETLIHIIEELDTGMRKQFQEKFEEIKREYDKAFKELFGGGKGTLELVEGEDILETGIRIIAQPPGKKLQNMMQLSGGEKALTAIALLFAIQNLKPSPFCLLDEIEAALDDSNVGRFANYLNKLTEHTQFIIITHRRGTMAAADRLYGITMQEKGVSTLVSVNLIEEDLDK